MKTIIIIFLFVFNINAQGRWWLFDDNLEAELTTLVTNSYRWVDSNSDGMPNNWAFGGFALTGVTSEVTTFAGFTGNVVKLVSDATHRPHLAYTTNVTNGRTYRVSFKYRNSNGGSQNVTIRVSTGAQTMTTEIGNLTSDEVVTFYQGTFTANATSVFGIALSGNAVATLYLDEIQLIDITP